MCTHILRNVPVLCGCAVTLQLMDSACEHTCPAVQLSRLSSTLTLAQVLKARHAHLHVNSADDVIPVAHYALRHTISRSSIVHVRVIAQALLLALLRHVRKHGRACARSCRVFTGEVCAIKLLPPVRSKTASPLSTALPLPYCGANVTCCSLPLNITCSAALFMSVPPLSRRTTALRAARFALCTASETAVLRDIHRM
jgi:hypothetical protein